MKRLILLIAVAHISWATSATPIAHKCASSASPSSGATTVPVDASGATRIILSVSYLINNPVTITDSSGSNAYTCSTALGSNPAQQTCWTSSATPTVSSSFTVTVAPTTPGSNSYAAFCFAAYNVGAVDTQNGATDHVTSAQTLHTGPITPSSTGELIVSGAAPRTGVPTIDSAFTIIDSIARIGSMYPAYLAALSAPSTSAVNPLWTNSLSEQDFDVSIASFLPAASPFTIAPAAVPSGHSGNITLTLSGVGTSWTAGTVFTTSGVANVTKISQSVTSATAATLVVKTGSGTGTLTVSETVTGGSVASLAVVSAGLTIGPNSGNPNSFQNVTLTGSGTLWSQETAAGLFTVSGGVGASIGTPTITANGAGVVTLTVGSAAGTLTITDTSTGATATFASGGGVGAGTCAAVWAQ